MYCFIKFSVFIVLINYVHSNQKPKILQSPSDVYGLLNQQVILRCDSSDASDKFSWIKDNVLINSNTNRYTLQLNQDSEGQYQCNVSNTNGFTLSDKFTVKIAYLHNFTESNNSRKYVSPSTTVLLQCSEPEGLPKPKIEWKSNLSINNPRFKLDSNNNLRIDNIQRSDAGLYWCEAKNLVFTKTSSSIELIVFQKPIFLILPKHLQIMVSSHIVFPCLVIGDSPMFVQWYKLGSGKNDVSLSRTSISTNCSMVINNVRLDDSGAYVCRARNSGGITEIIYKLSVISFPSFTETPENIRAKIGDKVFLRCSASGVPAPKVYWWHNNQYFHSDIDSNNRIIVFENGTLSISTVRSQDSGKYYCYAGSFVGVSRTESLLTVDVPKDMFPPVILKVPQNLTTSEGSNIILTCQVADLTSVVTWYKSSLKIVGTIPTSKRLELYKNGDLKITGAKIQDSTVYTCRATNKNLYTEKSAFLTVKSYSEINNEFIITRRDNEILNSPKNVTVEFIGDTYILIKWDYSNDEQMVWFRVEIAEQFNNNWMEITVTKQKNYLINNLKPDTGYMVGVRSIKHNRIGNVFVCRDIIYTLDTPTVAADIPFGEFHKALQEIEIYSVKLNTISSRQIQLSWKVKGNSILPSISGFIIKAEPVSIKRCLLMTEKPNQPLFTCLESEDSYNIENLANGYDDLLLTEQSKIQKTVIKRSINRDRPRSSAIIGGLKPFRCYEIEIETFIDHIKAGRISGRDSKTKTVLTFDDLPNKSPKVKKNGWIDNTTYQILWEKMDSRFSNGPITGYVIQIINMKDKFVQTLKIPVNVMQYSFKIDSPEHKYLLYLSADSCRGQGPRSSPYIIEFSESNLYKSDYNILQKPWAIPSAFGIFAFCILIVIFIIIIMCKKQRINHGFPKNGQIPLVSSNKEMEDSTSKKAAFKHFNQFQSQKLINNYDTISPGLELTSSDLFSTDIDPHSSTTTVPRFNCSSDDPASYLKLDENKNDSLAYASSSIIYKGCQHYNLNMLNKFPPNLYGPYIDVLNDSSNAHLISSESQLIGNPLIPPPPMYPPPPAPKNQSNFSDNNSELMLSNQGSINNTHSSESTSACGSNSNKSNKTRKSRTPQSINSSSSSKSHRNTSHKTSKSSERKNKDNSSPSIGGDKKKDSLSNSTHSSQKTGAVSFKKNSTNANINLNGSKLASRSQEQTSENFPDNISEQGLTSELSDTDTAGFDPDEHARDTDSVRVMYKLPMKRPSTPDYSTDSSYPYSSANHYSSVEPAFPKFPNNLPTKF